MSVEVDVLVHHVAERKVRSSYGAALCWIDLRGSGDGGGHAVIQNVSADLARKVRDDDGGTAGAEVAGIGRDGRALQLLENEKERGVRTELVKVRYVPGGICEKVAEGCEQMIRGAARREDGSR